MLEVLAKICIGTTMPDTYWHNIWVSATWHNDAVTSNLHQWHHFGCKWQQFGHRRRRALVWTSFWTWCQWHHFGCIWCWAGRKWQHVVCDMTRKGGWHANKSPLFGSATLLARPVRRWDCIHGKVLCAHLRVSGLKLQKKHISIILSIWYSDAKKFVNT